MSRHFKIALVLLLALAAIAGMSLWMQPHERIPWRTDFQAASAESRRTGKPMFVDFSAEWCGPCQDMRRTTWSDRAVAKALQDYIPLQVDLDKHPELAFRFAVNGIPHFTVLDPSGTVVKSGEGELSPSQFISWLHATAADDLQTQSLIGPH